MEGSFADLSESNKAESKKRRRVSRPYKRVEDAVLTTRIQEMRKKISFLNVKLQELTARCDAHVAEQNARLSQK